MIDTHEHVVLALLVKLFLPSVELKVATNASGRDQTESHFCSPVQHAAIASNNTPSTVLALVAMYINRLVVRKHKLCNRVGH